MTSISLRLSESLHKHAKEVARREGISMNQLILTALGEKLSALATEDYLLERAKRGSRKRFERALSKVKDREPMPHDRV